MSTAAEVLYGGTHSAATPAPATQALAATPAAASKPASPAAAPAPTSNAATAEIMFDGGRAQASDIDEGLFHDSGRSASLSGAFDPLRSTYVDANDMESVELIDAGRKEAAALANDLGIPANELQLLSTGLAQYVDANPSDEVLAAKQAATTAQLMKSWGSEYEKNVKYARQAAAEACARLPWLAGILENGAGSDQGVIERFAAIGRQRRRR